MLLAGPGHEALVPAVREAIPCLDIGEVLAQVNGAGASDPEGLASMLSVLAIDAAPADLVPALHRLLQAADPRAHEHVLATIVNVGWAELMPLAVAVGLAPQYTDAVRQQAEQVVQAYRQCAELVGAPPALAEDAWRPELVLSAYCTRVAQRPGS